MTHPEDLLSDALRDRADQRDLPSTPLADVESTARRIQRRRRVRTGVLTAVVVAVLATPFVIAATRGSETTTGPTDPSSTDAAPHLRLADVALGDPPATDWLDGSDYVDADGTRATLPLDHVSHATPYQGGFLVVGYGDDHLVLLDSQLHEVWRRCTTGGFAVSDDGLRTAYTTVGCDGSDPVVHLGPTDGTGDEQTAPLPIVDGWPIGVLGDAVVVSSFNTGPPVLVDFDGTPTSLDQLSLATGVDERLGLVSGQAVGGPRQRETGAVVDASTGAVTWTKPGWALNAFSPDGSMVLGVQIGSAPASSVGWAVFDAESGDPLHQFATPAGFAARRVVWEDDEHLLISITQGHTQALLRTTLDGAIQRASDPVPYDDDKDLRYGLGPNDFP